MKYLSVIFVAFFITACGGSSVLNNTFTTSIKKEKSLIIYKSAGEIQCEFKGYSPQIMAKELSKNAINVKESNCGSISGMMNISVCGASTSSVNIFRIDSKDLESAITLGFFSEESLPEGLFLKQHICN